jgi:hypothetical protein
MELNGGEVRLFNILCVLSQYFVSRFNVFCDLMALILRWYCDVAFSTGDVEEDPELERAKIWACPR